MASLRKKIFPVVILAVIAGLAVWLFLDDKAANPGPLSSAHEEIGDCEACHTPWKSITDEACLACHEFSDASSLRPVIRFHEEERFCLKCHFEHRGLDARISKVDHTLFNGNLQCTQCHLDRHEGLFGRECRQCHEITSWRIKGFRHPPEGDTNCSRCHKAPGSHYDDHFWTLIEEAHFRAEKGKKKIPVQECWRCHITHKWAHMRMQHNLSD